MWMHLLLQDNNSTTEDKLVSLQNLYVTDLPVTCIMVSHITDHIAMGRGNTNLNSTVP